MPPGISYANDVTVGYDQLGHGYVCAMGTSGQSPDGLDRGVWLWMTRDGGRRFRPAEAAVSGMFVDHPWLAVGARRTPCGLGCGAPWCTGLHPLSQRRAVRGPPGSSDSGRSHSRLANDRRRTQGAGLCRVRGARRTRRQAGRGGRARRWSGRRWSGDPAASLEPHRPRRPPAYGPRNSARRLKLSDVQQLAVPGEPICVGGTDPALLDRRRPCSHPGRPAQTTAPQPLPIYRPQVGPAQRRGLARPDTTRVISRLADGSELAVGAPIVVNHAVGGCSRRSHCGNPAWSASEHTSNRHPQEELPSAKAASLPCASAQAHRRRRLITSGCVQFSARAS